MLMFDLMDVKNVVSWNAMMSGYLDIGNGNCFKALKLLNGYHGHGFTYYIGCYSSLC